MKKLLSFLLVVALVMSFAVVLTACDQPFEAKGVALITDKGDINDKSFNQGSWEGVVQYAADKEWVEDEDYKYFRPANATTDDYIDSIELAITSGYNIIVTPGYLFEVPIYEVQNQYPNVRFILLDGAPQAGDYTTYETASNVASVMYAEEQAGFLAGYAAVKDGFTNLGFMGGQAVPAVVAFGQGYIQGAEYAAKELSLADGSVTMQYHYTGDFAESDKNKSTTNTMFSAGAEVVFGCGGSVGKSVFTSAEENSKKAIGVDVDQRLDSTTCITSATKGLAASVKLVLKSIIDDKDFETKYGGKTTYFNAANGGVGLPTTVLNANGTINTSGDAFDRFTSFNKTQYDAIYAKLVDGTVTGIIRAVTTTQASGIATAAELTTGLSLTKVVVTIVS